MKNWKVTAALKSPLAGDIPNLDSILEWEMSRRIGIKRGRKLTRETQLDTVQRPPIPLARRTIGGATVYCCSDPIIADPAAEWTDYISKRIDTNMIARLLAPAERKSIGTTSGVYKMRHAPLRVRLIDRIVWFAHCDVGQSGHRLRDILHHVYAIGKYRSIGYGLIDSWLVEEMGDNDFSLYADGRLMKTIPAAGLADGATGYKLSFGGAATPYWHPQNYQEVAIPC
jgi:hypothetical protein